MKILGNMERLLKRMPIQYPIPKSKWKLKWVTNWLHPKRRVKISFPQKPTTKPSDKSKTRHKRKKGVKPKPQTAPYDPFDKDLPEEAMEEMDRGQRLKYMLMDKERLRMQQKLQHLVPPADPLEAVVLPRFIHRQDVPGALIEAKRRIRQREDQRKIESASIFSEGETSSVAGGSTYETIGDSQLSMTDDIKSTASSEISSVSGMYQTNKVVKYVNGNYSEFSLWESDSFASQRPTPMLALPPLMTRAERSLPQKVSVKCIPPYGDFRAHIELDLCTQKALVWVSKTVSPEPLLEGQKCIQAYMEHFYWERLQKDSLNFHWFISEGILPCQYLIYEKTVEELDGLSHKKLDCQVLKYIGNVNKSDYPRQPCTDIMAYFMVTCYFRMLHKRATQKWRGTSDRFFLRSRFAVSLVETYCLENGVLFFKDNLHCNQLLEWCLMHEYRVRCLYREAEESSCERTRLHADAAMVIKTPNIEVFKDFYQRNVTPKPDALAINPCQKAIRPYPSSEAQRHEFYCPIQGCSAGLNFTLVMSHFIINHCRRVEELWLEDRMIIMFYPRTYPPTQLYCLCVMALQRRKPILNETVIIPRQIQNAELPPKMLFYADHFPCLLMYCQVDQRLLVKSLFNGKIESKWKSKGCEWLYVFWIATNRLTEHPNAACRLYVYCQDYSVKGNALLNFVDLAEFKGVEDLVIYHPDSYLAFDQKTMVALTKDFKELVFIDVRHVNRDNFDAEFSGDDTWDL
ncbi:hypothetical protein KR018_003355 [Drosophila ironensis]|nr:hypothetical protein KR018_003355 [Drosophila ironensis]